MQRLKIYGSILVVIAVFAVIAGAYNKGVQSGLETAELQARRDMEQLAKTNRAIVAEQIRIAKASAAQQERIRVVYRTIRQDVVRYVETHSAVECVDSQGVEIINKAAKGAP